jgi:hypothetical protein
MARKKKAQTQPVLFADLPRRHPRLILPKLLADKATVFPFDDARFRASSSELERWADLADRGDLLRKETALDSHCLTVIFRRALGYKVLTDNPEAYQLEPQFSVPGAGTADGALGRFGRGQKELPDVLIECKDATTDLDHDRFNGRTPVQQLWDYLAQLPETPWGILTNYLEFRLYHRDSPMRVYQEFTVADFRNPTRVREFLYLFNPDGLLGCPPLQPPRALDLLTHTQDRRVEVGDQLYDYYANQRLHLIDALIKEHKYSQDDAIHVAQRLLDRIVFIAFCEDRGLLPQKLLENTWKNVPPLARVSNPRWQNFLDTFHAIDKGHRSLDLPTGYNGGLFADDPLIDDLDLADEPWTEVFKNIGNYDFRDEGEVNVDVLGHIFEKSITELEKLRVLGLFGKQAGSTVGPAMPKSAMRKRFGIYYTPPQFTHFIVEKTVGQLIAERVEPLEDPSACLAALRELTIVDPACGSGAFLIAAYEVLESGYELILHRLRLEGRMAEAAEVERGYPDWILAENLFGVDVSNESVEITQLALWIRSARKGRTLADLSKNIVCGNSLVADESVDDRAMNWRSTFPGVFASGGFDCVIGNPPWEKISLKKREFFALVPEVLGESNAEEARKKIDALEQTNPQLAERWKAATSTAAKTLEYVRRSGRFPLGSRGDVNTYTLFTELSRQLVAPGGLVGLLVPSGIATDDTTKLFFADLMENNALTALYDFENKKGVFADLHRSFKFSVLLLNGCDRRTEAADFLFFARDLDDLKPRDRHIVLSAGDLKLLNPNTRTCPIFRTVRDCSLTKGVYRRIPVLVDESRKAGGNPWRLRLTTMFHQSADAGAFVSANKLKEAGGKFKGNCWFVGKKRFLPCYEAKMVQPYDHRAAHARDEKANWLRRGQTDEVTLVEHQNPEFAVMPRWWVDKDTVAQSLRNASLPALLSFRKVTSPTNTRTMLAAFIPLVGLIDSQQLILFDDEVDTPGWRKRCCLLANLNSYVYDYVTRQKIGGVNLNFFIVEQLPTLPPDCYDEKCPWDKKHTLEEWIADRVLKLTCTADDMRPLAKAAGFSEGVHKWNEAERQELLAELDAAYFLLYGLGREDVDYVLDQFQGVLKQDEAHGRPGPIRRAIREAYDTLQV